MLSIFVIAILIYGFYSGYRTGLIMQAVRLVGYVITFVVASRYFDALNHWVEMFVPFPAVQADSQLAMYTEAQSFYLDQAFYKLLTFLIIWLMGWLLTQILSSLLTRLTYYDVLNVFNRLLGGVINLLVVYFIVFMVLYLLSLLPIEFIQQQFVNHPLLFWIVDASPLLSDFIHQLGLGI